MHDEGVLALITPICTPTFAAHLSSRAQVGASLGRRSRLFVAVDAPRLQQAVAEFAQHRVFFTPGVGVDPTNEYRDAKQSQLQGQQTGRQDLAERNLIKVRLEAARMPFRWSGPRSQRRTAPGWASKAWGPVRSQVSLDYYIQGFCLSMLTLRPSAFYNAANRRTSAVLPSIWRSLRVNISREQTGSSGCSLADASSFDGMVGCMRDTCGLVGCNNRQ